MKYSKIILSVSVLLLMLGASTSVTSEVPGDLVVTMDSYHMDFSDEHATADRLEANLTEAGSEFNLITANDTWGIPDDTDVLLNPGTDGEFTDSEIDDIVNWFESDGPKLFWAAGDSDYSSYFTPTILNGILEELGTDLRIGAESVEDETNNDGSAYRVAATNAVTDGEVNAKIGEGIDNGIIMHGPTPILAEVDGEITSIDEIDNAEVLMETSADAVAFDSDLSETKYDYYGINEIEAPFPMIAIQDLGDGKWVIVSGEAVFSDYKWMYGIATESGSFNGGQHEGKEFVDNVLSWFSESGDSDSIGGSDDGPLPVNLVPFAVGIVTLAVIVRRRR